MDPWFFLVLLSVPLGFGFWLFFTATHGFLYLDSLRKKLGFYLAPYAPPWFILLKHVDGKVEQFYDVRVWKGRSTHLLRLGEYVVTMDVNPHEASIMVSLTDARGPPGQPSPYGLAWRVLVGWAFALYMCFLSWDFTFLARVIDGLQPSWEGWLSLTALIVILVYFFHVLHQINIPQTRYLGLIVVGVDPPHLHVVPELSVFDPKPPVRGLKLLARNVVINVPESLEHVIEKLRERLGTDEAVAAWVAAKAELADIWRKNLAEVREEMASVRTVARRMIRMKELRELTRPSLSRILLLLVVFLAGLVVGYLVGSSWAVSLTPPPGYNTTQAHSVQAMVKPAPPPPPPGVDTTNPPVHPATPPPPPGTNTTSPPVHPAQAPPPPG